VSNIGVLVVDDDADTRTFLDDVLRREGVQTLLAGSGQQALALLEREPAEVLFVDLVMPDMDGLELLRRVRRVRPQVSAVVISGHARVDSCIEALRLGVCDYLTKPFAPQAIRTALGLALERCGSIGSRIALRPQVRTAPGPAGGVDGPDDSIVVRSAAMRPVCDLLAKIAPALSAVLIRGEPGVGKETVARAIHRQSRRAGGPFVRVNGKAIREAELSARLFGAPQRDAEGKQRGLLQEAQGGTVFFSQVDHLPFWAQVQLLDVLQSGCVHRRAGRRPMPMDLRPMPMDVRVIASTSGDLEAAMAEGRFSREIYYYLNVVTLHVPPLRQRPQDFEILAQRCLAQAVARQGVADGNRWCFAPAAWECLRSYDWPGNLPELASVVARAVAMSDGPEIGKGAIDFALPRAPGGRSGTFPVSLVGNLHQIERSIIDEVIQRSGGNKAAAARVLGLHRRTLYRILGEN
jgi:DNA-binding NtrC family response regulator